MSFIVLLWHFLNTPIGTSVFLACCSYVGVYLFKKKPAWEKIWAQNKGFFFDAVRFAETAIPDGSPNSASARAKAALDYIQKLDHPVASADPAHLVAALEATHAIESQKE